MAVLKPVTVNGKLTADGLANGKPLANTSFEITAKETIHVDGRTILPVPVVVTTDSNGNFSTVLDTIEDSYRTFYTTYPDELNARSEEFILLGTANSPIRFENLHNQNYPSLPLAPGIVTLIHTIVDDAVIEGGKSAYEVAVDNGYVGTEAQWLLSLKGTNGINGTNGTNGTNGKSAYQIALDNGFVGSQSAWLESLKGEDGASDIDDIPGLQTNLTSLQSQINEIYQIPGAPILTAEVIS